jgi:hypothetical protein
MQQVRRRFRCYDNKVIDKIKSEIEKLDIDNNENL